MAAVSPRCRAWLVCVGMALAMLAATARAVSRDFSEEKVEQTVFKQLFSGFGFEAGGVINATISVTPAAQRGAYVALYRTSDWDRWSSQLSSYQSYLRGLCRFPSTLRVEIDGTTSFRHVVPFRGQYSLVLLACQGDNVDFEGTLSYTNPTAGDAQHLSLEYTSFPVLMRGLLVMYFMLTVVWLGYCKMQFPVMTMVHKLMCVTAIVKVAEMVVSSWYWRTFGVEGIQGSALFTAKQLAETVSDTMFLLTLLLLALGWMITRYRLSRKELQVIISVFVVYVLVGASRSICGDSDTLCQAITLGEYVVRSLIMLGIIVAMNFNITHLRASIFEGPWAPSLPAHYQHLKQLQTYRWTFLSFLLLPTLLLIVKITVLSWRFEWVSQLLQELLLLYVYAHVAITFRPRTLVTFIEIANAHQAAMEQRAREEGEHAGPDGAVLVTSGSL